MSQQQTIKTAIHEMAHQKLHSGENRLKQNRRSKEVEAESIAYTVCQHYGIDTSDYSFTYVAAWSEGKETSELKDSLDKIRKAASEMITDINQALEELQQEKVKNKFNQRASVLDNLHIKKEQVKNADYEQFDKVSENYSHEKTDRGGER